MSVTKVPMRGVNTAVDTAAGDDANIGWTAGEGLILTGQGSTNDITIKNDADADVIKIATGGTTTTFTGDVTMTGTTPTLTIGDAGAEDTAIVFDGNAQDFHIGLDDTADDLVIGKGSALGTTTHMAFTEDGEVLKPLNPFFNAISSAQSNVTGDNTVYTVLFATENDDVGSNYNTSNGTFTAPVTGMYQFNAVVGGQGYSGNEFMVQMYFNTSNDGAKAYDQQIHDAAVTNLYDAGDNSITSFGASAAFQMDASDTIVVQFIVNGTGGKTVDVAANSYFSGYLIG